MNTLENIIKLCSEYVEDNDCVYKICLDCYLVVMKKLPDTITNENRKDVFDTNYAAFRANKLKVLFIVNLFDTTDRPLTLISKFGHKKTLYIVEQIVVPDKFDNNINAIRSGGIHYFKTIEAAYSYNNIRESNYTGPWIEWNHNGIKQTECEYVNGKISGNAKEWHFNGQIYSEGKYIEDVKDGEWTEWYENGNKNSIGLYANGKKSGNWVCWHDNGQKMSEGEYVEGKPVGKLPSWNKNGHTQIYEDIKEITTISAIIFGSVFGGAFIIAANARR